ncbi:hypothetical protein C8R44DRAFT_883206 [Mycena epipterygia]|nr:hypothetical protein C8R44DRAFT_883206 [Mycena epipterygia]
MSDSQSPVSTLSDGDNQLLFIIGHSLTQDAVGLIWETLWLSAYSVFFCLAIWSIFCKGLKSTSAITMLLIVVYLYATSFTLWSLNTTLWFKRAHVLLMDHPELLLADHRELSNANLEVLGTPMESLFMFHRRHLASVGAYSRSLRVMTLPCFMLLMSFIFAVIDMTCLTRAGWSNQTAIVEGGPICVQAKLISWAFSLMTNTTCTLIISYKAWQHRRSAEAGGLSITPARMSTN